MRKFEWERKPSKIVPTSKENITIIKALNNFGRVPEQHELLDMIETLKQENEELKKNQRYYKNGVFSLEYDKETMSDMIDDYKSRVEKAVEYIKQLEHTEWVTFGREILLDVLNGKE